MGMDWVSRCTYRWYGVVCETVVWGVDRFYATAKHTVLDPSVDRAPLNEPANISLISCSITTKFNAQYLVAYINTFQALLFLIKSELCGVTV
jgi:hypothetical protein